MPKGEQEVSGEVGGEGGAAQYLGWTTSGFGPDPGERQRTSS